MVMQRVPVCMCACPPANDIVCISCVCLYVCLCACDCVHNLCMSVCLFAPICQHVCSRYLLQEGMYAQGHACLIIRIITQYSNCVYGMRSCLPACLPARLI